MLCRQGASHCFMCLVSIEELKSGLNVSPRRSVAGANGLSPEKLRPTCKRDQLFTLIVRPHPVITVASSVFPPCQYMPRCCISCAVAFYTSSVAVPRSVHCCRIAPSPSIGVSYQREAMPLFPPPNCSLASLCMRRILIC